MKAIILCGGEGSRLRPLTCDTPKPLTPLCGRPVICYLLDKLVEAGVDEAYLTVKYLADKFVTWFDEHPETRLKLSFVAEETPLGTAGSVGNCRDHLDDDFLVVSGDALFSFDLKEAVAYHREKKAAATLLTAKVDDPREYGCVVTDKDGRITSFCEKPDWSGVMSDRANTGLYVLSPSVLPLIPKNRVCDFAADVFPLMLARHLPLYAKEESGYWCDIGGISAYEQCQFDILTGKVGALPERAGENGIFCRDGEVPKGDYEILPPVYFGTSVTVGDGCRVGPNVVLGDGCRVGAGSSLRHTVALDHVYIGNNCELRGALLCENASVESTGRMFEGSVLGAHAKIGVGATIGTNVRIWPEKNAGKKTRVNENIKWGDVSPSLFDEDGITGESGVGMTPPLCARAGQAAATVFAKGKIAVASDGQLPSRLCLDAFAAGATAGGAQVIFLGESFDTLMTSTVRLLSFDAGFFFDSAGNRTTIRPCGKDGLPLDRAQERKFTSALTGNDFNRCGWDDYREPQAFDGAWMLTQKALTENLPDLRNISCRVNGCNGTIQHFADELFSSLGIESGKSSLRFHIGRSGHTLAGFDERGTFLPVHRLELLVAEAVLSDGEDIAVPNDAPALLERLAEKHGRKILRYSLCPSDDSDLTARKLAATQRYTLDGFAALLRLLSVMATQNRRLCDIDEEVPHLETSETEFTVSGNVQEVLMRLAERLRGTTAGDGVRIAAGDTDAYCRISKRGDALRVCVRASDMEAAREFGEEIRKKAGL